MMENNKNEIYFMHISIVILILSKIYESGEKHEIKLYFRFINTRIFWNNIHEGSLKPQKCDL